MGGDMEVDGGNVSPERPKSPNEEIAAEEAYDWSAFYDDEGQLYYYNNVTQESSWDPPEKFNPPPPQEEDDDAETTTQEQQDASATAEDEEDVEGRPIGGSWVAHLDDEGNEYYYNTETGETQWDKPEIGETTLETPDDIKSDIENEEKKDSSSPRQQREVETSPKKMDDDEGKQPEDEMKAKEEISKEEVEPEKDEKEEEEDPEVKKLETAKTAINETDSIMEPSCSENVRTLYEGGVQIPEILQSLVKSYQGQTLMCSLLAEWLVNLKSSSSSSSSAVSRSSRNKVADSVRDVIEEVLVKIVKEHFTKERGDHILDLLQDNKSERVMLEQMIKSDRWRKLLIDLSASNKDSVLLEVCLVQISNAGHHREIARRINASDHFAVYNGMVTAEFAVIGKEDSTEVYKLMTDLQRSCTSAPHTYLYATKVLDALLSKIKEETKVASPTNGAVLSRASRKFERLKEELEGAMIDPASSEIGSSPLFKKRRLDVALTISNLHQRQRRRPLPSSVDDDDNNSGALSRDSKDQNVDSLETALLNLLKRHSLGTRLDDRLLNQLLQDEVSLSSAKGQVGKLLIAHPLAIKVLLGHMYKKSRVGSAEIRRKCARLVALAVVAAESIAGEETENREIAKYKEEASLTETVLLGSKLCEKVENMFSFTVTSDTVSDNAASPGMQLSSLALQNASVAQGVMMWASTIVSGPDFVASASYTTLSPSILSLIRLISTQHPFTRREATEIAFVFLRHQNSEIAYQKMTDLKEQSLRLLLSLLIKGEVTSVLGEVTKRLKQQGKMEIDASLIRYFVGGILDICRPPYSLSFIRSTGQMLLAPKCTEALKSSYLGDTNKKRLASLISSFKLSLSNLLRSTSEDKAMVLSLVSTYK